MRQNTSNCEIEYIKRRIYPKIRELVESFPVTVLTGARQVGKSTLLNHEFTDFSYVSLDDYALRGQARLDPQSLWKGCDRLIIDEAQKQPELFEAIKLEVDRPRHRRKFILSGSANMLLMEKVSETLAGRAAFCELFPMTHGESESRPSPRNFSRLWKGDFEEPERKVEVLDPLPFLMRGFMPPLLGLKKHNAVINWLEGYVRTYLERDLRELSQVDSLIDFRRVMQMLALRTGNILNQANIAKESGISHPTTHRYLKLMEVSNIIARVPAYSVNRTKRLVKSPKVFWVDPALAVFLSGYYDSASLSHSRELGGFFECLIYLHLRAHCEAMTPCARLNYWRTVSGGEVDFVVEHGRRLLAFEAKNTANPTISDIRGLLLFLEEYPETVRGVLVHSGERVFWIHSKVLAVPWWWLDR